jgi:hypothetical protein
MLFQAITAGKLPFHDFSPLSQLLNLKVKIIMAADK